MQSDIRRRRTPQCPYKGPAAQSLPHLVLKPQRSQSSRRGNGVPGSPRGDCAFSPHPPSCGPGTSIHLSGAPPPTSVSRITAGRPWVLGAQPNAVGVWDAALSSAEQGGRGAVACGVPCHLVWPLRAPGTMLPLWIQSFLLLLSGTGLGRELSLLCGREPCGTTLSCTRFPCSEPSCTPHLCAVLTN